LLYGQTGGHALFTVELLRGLQERGDLIRDAQGRWIEGPDLDWEEMPPRVEGVIGQRIGRLPQARQQELRAASVQGEVFAAEVLARVRSTGEQEAIDRLSGELSATHRLVVAESLERLGSQPLSHYRFRHFLFQKYLYGKLDQVQRTRLHQATGNALEELYGDRSGEVAVQLAHHFEEAGLAGKAIEYLYEAGNRSVRQFANEEAIAHYCRGLELLESLPDTPERVQIEFGLQTGLGTPLATTKGYGSPEVRRAMDRAVELSQRMPDTPELAPAWYLMATYYLLRADFPAMLRVCQQMADAAERWRDPLAFPLHWTKQAVAVFYLGDLESARGHLEAAAACYDRDRHRALALVVGGDMGVVTLGYLAFALWYLGYPDSALQRGREALGLVQTLDHPYSMAEALFYAAHVHWLRREDQRAIEYAQAAIDVSRPRGMVVWEACAMHVRGRALVRQRAAEEGKAELRRALALWESSGSELDKEGYFVGLAEACAAMGQVEEGLALLEEALTLVERTGEIVREAEIRRVKGELLLMQGHQAEAEADFRTAIVVARRQKARSLELQATVSLARLLQQQGKREEALEMLADIYGWFTEGFDTRDLREAKSLLEELGSPV
ncbi:MAG TPA: tetratricopeptide repeat protein, partial [Anaerolineae bacterium]|nr:tetratricopeptide repeat protein [Anaerolineae bacterium]